MALPDLSKNSVSAPPPTFNEFSDDQLLSSFKQDPTAVARKLIKQPNQLDRFWRLLGHHFPQDQELVKAYDKTQNILGKIPPAPQTQPQPQAAPTAPPIVPAAQIIPIQTPTTAGNNITAQNAPQIAAWMNGLKDHVYGSFAQSARRDIGASKMFTQSLLSSLSLYRGGLAGFYLSEGSKELIFSALGPIGNAFRSLYEKDVQNKMSWMKNPLNPNAILYYLNSLPTRQAFQLLYLPAKATFGILARTGSPLISKVHYQEYGQTKQNYIFTPLLRATQVLNKLADGADKLSGVSTDDFKKYWKEKSPYDRYIENKNLAFSSALNELKKAKAMGQSSRIFGANKKINNLLKQYDGKFGSAIIRGLRVNLAKRLRRASRDPFVGLFTLITGALFDISVGFIVNVARVVATKIINVIPGLNTLRATVTEFFTSNRWLQTARIGGATGQAFLRGTFSMTTASSVYGGASIGGWLANALGLPAYPFQVIGGGIGATFGSIYTTSLKMANNSLYFQTIIPGEKFGHGWVQKIQHLESTISGPSSFSKIANAKAELNAMSLNGFRLGPFTRFANWLFNHPFVRIPINGFMVGDVLSPFMQAQYGWDPWVTRGIGVAIDYFWQIKGALGNVIWKKWLAPPITKFIQITANKFIRFYWEKIAHVFNPGNLLFVERPWFTFTNKYIFTPISKAISFVKPFIQNLINPGLFLGAGLIPLLTPALGTWAYLVGPVLGSGAWLISTRIAASILPKAFMSPAAFMSRFNALGWTGFIIGQLSGWLVFGWNVPFWYTAAWSIGLPTLTIGLQFAASAFGLSLTQFLAGAISGLTQGAISIATAAAGIAQGLAIWATITSLAAVTGLTVFAAYTIYSGFWVPLMENIHAGPQSSQFSITTNVTKLAPGKFQICSPFSISKDIFSSQKYLTHKIELENSFLTINLTDTVNLTDPNKATQVFRDRPLNYIAFDPANLTPDDYTLTLPDQFDPPFVGHAQIPPYLESFLSTPTTQEQNLFSLMQNNASVVFGMKPFFDILTNLAQEHNQPHHLVAEYEAQLTLINKQKDLVAELFDEIKNNNLTNAIAIANNYFSDNPLTDPCPDETQTCPSEKQGLKQLFNSWENIVNQYIITINNYLNQTSPDLQPFQNSLEQEKDDLKQQIDSLDSRDGLIQKIKNIQKDLTANDAAKILTTNFLNFPNLSLVEQNDTWILLAKYFSDTFNKSITFFFVPKGTNYQVCAETDYCYAINPTISPVCPTGQPITVCSTIAYTPSVWTPNTGLARSCATFTP